MLLVNFFSYIWLEKEDLGSYQEKGWAQAIWSRAMQCRHGLCHPDYQHTKSKGLGQTPWLRVITTVTANEKLSFIIT